MGRAAKTAFAEWQGYIGKKKVLLGKEGSCQLLSKLPGVVLQGAM